MPATVTSSSAAIRQRTTRTSQANRKRGREGSGDSNKAQSEYRSKRRRTGKTHGRPTSFHTQKPSFDLVTFKDQEYISDLDRSADIPGKRKEKSFSISDNSHDHEDIDRSPGSLARLIRLTTPGTVQLGNLNMISEPYHVLPTPPHEETVGAILRDAAFSTKELEKTHLKREDGQDRLSNQHGEIADKLASGFKPVQTPTLEPINDDSFQVHYRIPSPLLYHKRSREILTKSTDGKSQLSADNGEREQISSGYTSPLVLPSTVLTQNFYMRSFLARSRSSEANQLMCKNTPDGPMITHKPTDGIRDRSSTKTSFNSQFNVAEAAIASLSLESLENAEFYYILSPKSKGNSKKSERQNSPSKEIPQTILPTSLTVADQEGPLSCHTRTDFVQIQRKTEADIDQDIDAVDGLPSSQDEWTDEDWDFSEDDEDGGVRIRSSAVKNV